MSTRFEIPFRPFSVFVLLAPIVLSLFPSTSRGQVVGAIPEISVRFSPFYRSSDQPDVKHRLSSPAALAIAASGNIYVFDDGNSRIVKLSDRGGFLAEFNGTTATQLTPGGLSDTIALDKSENVYVAGGDSRVQVFRSDGSLVRSFRVPFVIDSVAVNGAGEILVAVAATKNVALVHVFSNSGKFLRTIGERIVAAEGTLSREVNRTVIAVDGHDNLLVAFRHWPLIRKYSRYGKLLGESGYKVPPQLIPESQKNYSLQFVSSNPNASFVLPLLAHSISVGQAGVYVLLNGHSIVRTNDALQALEEGRFRESDVPTGSLFARLVASSGTLYFLDIRSGSIYTARAL